ncbi:hypothetical protein K402DRAFT_464143 [Aulographum hederae CBS 113979]|uniref:Uncharacterized protein n=1 Tax=Aulographum hederae CBS 113979 TaxID=1176131 RepID=A0A6G1GXY6_9PEZI|nr:hypothetical protein K402DRAFT_464143 [Aulographum hederae CBS 113979]
MCILLPFTFTHCTHTITVTARCPTAEGLDRDCRHAVAQDPIIENSLCERCVRGARTKRWIESQERGSGIGVPDENAVGTRVVMRDIEIEEVEVRRDGEAREVRGMRELDVRAMMGTREVGVSGGRERGKERERSRDKEMPARAHPHANVHKPTSAEVAMQKKLLDQAKSRPKHKSSMYTRGPAPNPLRAIEETFSGDPEGAERRERFQSDAVKKAEAMRAKKVEKGKRYRNSDGETSKVAASAVSSSAAAAPLPPAVTARSGGERAPSSLKTRDGHVIRSCPQTLGEPLGPRFGGPTFSSLRKTDDEVQKELRRRLEALKVSGYTQNTTAIVEEPERTDEEVPLPGPTMATETGEGQARVEWREDHEGMEKAMRESLKDLQGHIPAPERVHSALSRSRQGTPDLMTAMKLVGRVADSDEDKDVREKSGNGSKRTSGDRDSERLVPNPKSKSLNQFDRAILRGRKSMKDLQSSMAASFSSSKARDKEQKQNAESANGRERSGLTA